MIEGKIKVHFPGGSVIKNLPVKQEAQVLSLGQEDPPGSGSQHTPIFLPGKSHGQRSLEVYSPGSQKTETTEQLAKQQIVILYLTY